MKSRLAIIRKQRGMTQQDLAELVPCSREHISKVENNKTNKSYKLLSRIAHQLKVDIQEIL
jgi:transcriptional regulator with XRE-family HTH domain